MINKDMQEKIIQKSRMKMAISNFEKENIEMKLYKNKIFKMVSTIILATGITGGLAYATSTAIDKIWKEPESYKVNNEVTQKENQESISKEEAENICNNYLTKIGLTNEKIQKSELIKKYFSNNDNLWNIDTENVSMSLDAKTGKIESINIPTWKHSIPDDYGISREEARKVAKELLEKYKTEDYNGEYELVKLTRNSENDEDSYIWYAIFYKKYGNLLNPYEKVSIGWIPTINELYNLSIQNDVYEDNEEKISKDEAINIAIEKDKQIETNKSIIETNAVMQIKQMNENVYLRENFKEEYENGTFGMEEIKDNGHKIKDDATFYKTDGRVRKVWNVVITYNNFKDDGISNFSYYVDCTTGEIIGGERYDSSKEIDNMLNDPYNVK